MNNNLIVFEGPNGSGKSTIMEKVADKLKDNYKVFTSKEPGGIGNVQKKIRKLLLSNNDNIDKITELLLFSANRRDHIKEIKKRQKDYDFILSDRYWESSLVFQLLTNKQIDDKQLNSFLKFNQEFVMQGLYPKKTYIIFSKKNLNNVNSQDTIEKKNKRNKILSQYILLNDANFIDYDIEYINTSNKHWQNYINYIYNNILTDVE